MADQPHPWAGEPRRFVASAMPQGDRVNGVPGPLVAVREHLVALPASSSEAVGEQKRGGALCTVQVREKLYSREEAEQLRDELSAALRALGLGERFVAGGEDAPRACTAPYPFRNHGTLAEVGFEGDVQ